jgi:hypothetical protein
MTENKMNEREELLETISQSIITLLSGSEMFHQLVATYTENEDLLATPEDSLLSEHLEQAAIDGVADTIAAIRDIADRMKTVFSEERIEAAIQKTIEDFS